MTQWFAGQFLQKVDGKCRVSIPAEFRRVLEKGDSEWEPGGDPRFAIVFGDGDSETPACLRREFMECFPIELYHRTVSWIFDNADDTPEMNEARVELYCTHSHLATIDTTGRIVISPRLRERFGLSGGALFVAAGDTFQIWRPETYASHKKARRQTWQEKLPSDFNPRVSARHLRQNPAPGSEP